MEISGKTKIVGIFGYPVSHSLSPLFQNAAFKALGLDFVYLPFSVKPKDLKIAVESIKSLNMVGVNVTIPHKKKILPYLDELSPEVRMMEAVNTVCYRDDKLIGYNTDGKGFISSLTEEGGFNPQGKKALILGAGGAARAISFALIEAGVKKLSIANRTRRKAKVLLEHLKKFFQGKCKITLIDFDKVNSSTVMNEVDLLVNATSVGMHTEDPLLIDVELLTPHTFVYDVVYNRKTELLKAAEERNLSCLGGSGMLIYQGACSFEIWTHKKAPLKKMKEALER
ncbi:MAG: shikimate dehydrogenase [Candidatus Aerophobetes bacterium]|nr:shikimate dehydrogenase [Candidatus Aerophobetes bacterium]